MKLRILGCSGGIGGDLRTTSMLLDHDVLIDAGTGVGDLSIEELSRIDHVFVTHSHLDHVTSIPFMVDSVGWMRDKPITVHAIEPTLEILRQHLFNWKLWPDFTQIPDAQKPFLRYEPVMLGKTVEVNGRKLTPLPANHVVPAVGYHMHGSAASLVFSGDTTSCPALWDYVNRAMPFNQPRSLSPDDVYSLTAYILYLNGIVTETEQLDQNSLPAVKMPNRDGFIVDPRPDIKARR